MDRRNHNERLAFVPVVIVAKMMVRFLFPYSVELLEMDCTSYVTFSIVVSINVACALGGVGGGIQLRN